MQSDLTVASEVVNTGDDEDPAASPQQPEATAGLRLAANAPAERTRQSFADVRSQAERGNEDEDQD